MTTSTPTAPHAPSHAKGSPVDDEMWAAVQSTCREEAEGYAARLGLAVRSAPVQPGEAFRLEIPGLPFPDSIGTGTVVIVGLHFRGARRPRLDITLDHNRVFAHRQRDTVHDRLFLNDYKFARSFAHDAPLSAHVLRDALRQGVEGARQGLERTRDRVRKVSPWGARLLQAATAL